MPSPTRPGKTRSPNLELVRTHGLRGKIFIGISVHGELFDIVMRKSKSLLGGECRRRVQKRIRFQIGKAVVSYRHRSLSNENLKNIVPCSGLEKHLTGLENNT